jgi:hypothetical protein
VGVSERIVAGRQYSGLGHIWALLFTQ